MQRQILLKTSIIIIIFIITVLLIIGVAFFFWPNEVYIDPIVINKEVSKSLVKEAKIIKTETVIKSDLSSRLIIPIINVDTLVESLGLLPNGEIDTPDGPYNASWYNLGPKPGDIGSAIITGHYGWKDGIPAVFDNLSKLKIGDIINFKNDKGEILIFIVREIHVFGEYEDATRVFISSDNKAHLNLITCGGVWDKIRKSYSNRLVVFTDKI